MATTWDAWDDDVLSEIPGPTPAFVRFHVKLAAIEFCKRAWVWLVDQGPIAIVATDNTYDWGTPALPANAVIAHVLQAWVDKCKIIPKTRNELSAMYGDYMHVDGAAQFFIEDLPSTLILVPTPTAASTYGLTAKVAIAPTRAAAGIDTPIFDRYFDEIAIGAKARLLVMARKPWTDVARGAALREDFEQAIAKSKTDVLKSYASARLRVKAKFF